MREKWWLSHGFLPSKNHYVKDHKTIGTIVHSISIHCTVGHIMLTVMYLNKSSCHFGNQNYLSTFTRISVTSGGCQYVQSVYWVWNLINDKKRRHFGIIAKLYTMKVAPKHKVVCSIVWVEEVHRVVVVATTHMWVHFEKGVPGRFVSRRASKSKAGRMRRGCCHRGQKALLSSLLREVALALLLVLCSPLELLQLRRLLQRQLNSFFWWYNYCCTAYQT